MIVDLKTLLSKNLKRAVIVIPTDTVYGLATPIDYDAGIEKIYKIKSRESQKPLPVLCANVDQVKRLVKDFSSIQSLATRYWPGALTLITDKSERVSDKVTSGLLQVGIRIPNHPEVLKILEVVGPMAVTSLNISNEPPVLTFSAACEYETSVDFILEGPDLNNPSSTVYDVNNKKILRQGVVNITHD